MRERYYYKDPLAAAWMNYNFHVRLINKQAVELTLVNSTSGGDLMAGGRHSFPPFFIHPDSYPILKPREGDLLCMRFSSSAGLSGSGVPFYLDMPFDEYIESFKINIIYESHRIFQRNGIAFIWPEKETVEEGATNDQPVE